MSLEAIARTTVSLPSITSWTRLEPQPRDASMARSLQAQIRDPLWILARQWQVGEFLGSDAGSPVQATVAGEMQTVTISFQLSRLQLECDYCVGPRAAA